ncbi:MAG: OB-fold nucleic acid binding domain-containing protein [Candidatus Nanohaloarchaea archaeon]
MPEQQRRKAAKPKNVEDIDPQRDIRVRIVGTVLSLEDESITVDDGTGTVEVFMNEESLEEVEEGEKARIMGRVLPTPDGFEIQAEVVQDFSSVDTELYDKVKKIVNTSE